MVCENASVRVTVGGTEIPVIETVDGDDPAVVTRIRKDGPAAITKLTDVYFPAVWNGQDVLSQIGISDGEGVTDLATVEFRDPDTGEFVPAHRGYVRGIGSAGETRRMRLQIGDISHFVNRVNASKSFGDDPAVEDVLRYVTTTLEDNVSLVDGITPVAKVDQTAVDPEEETSVESSTLPAIATDFAIELFVDIGEAIVEEFFLTGKSFQANKHRLSDVLDWLTEKTGTRWWMDYAPSQGGFVLVLASEPSRPTFTAPGEISVLDNRALFDIQPLNEVTVVGDSPQFRHVNQPERAKLPSDEYPFAVARHEKLYQLAGNSALSPPRIHKSVNFVRTAEQAAKKELQERLDGATGGTILLRGKPTVTPYSVVEAPLACQGIELNTDLGPLPFDVERARHIGSVREGYTTEVDVSLTTGASEITIVESGTREN